MLNSTPKLYFVSSQAQQGRSKAEAKEETALLERDKKIRSLCPKLGADTHPLDMADCLIENPLTHQPLDCLARYPSHSA